MIDQNVDNEFQINFIKKISKSFLKNNVKYYQR